MSDIFWVAVIALLGPLLLSALNNRNSRKSKQADWERQDRVAAAAAKVAKDLAADSKEIAETARQVASDLSARQTENTAALDRVAETAARNAESTNSQLHQIHTLVNSDMTAARSSELIAVEAHLATLKRNLTTLGSPSPDEQEVINNLTNRAIELRAILADRLAQQKKAEADLVAEGRA